MNSQELQQLSNAYDAAIPDEMWREEGGGYDQQVAVQAYQTGARMMAQHIRLMLHNEDEDALHDEYNFKCRFNELLP